MKPALEVFLEEVTFKRDRLGEKESARWRGHFQAEKQPVQKPGRERGPSVFEEQRHSLAGVGRAGVGPRSVRAEWWKVDWGYNCPGR